MVLRPPWIAVDHELCSVIVARWPGKLWAVEMLDPITAADLKSAGQVGLRPDAGYTRAAAVKILHAVPVATLFGQHGEPVCAVIEAAAALTLAQAKRLSEGRHRDAGAAQTRLWRRWLVREGIPLRYDDLDGTLAIGASKAGSPLGMAPRTIHGEVGRRAETLAGPAVWLFDRTDPEGAWLAEPWCTASTALLDAAFAFGPRIFWSRQTMRFLLPPGSTPSGRSRLEVPVWASSFWSRTSLCCGAETPTAV